MINKDHFIKHAGRIESSSLPNDVKYQKRTSLRYFALWSKNKGWLSENDYSSILPIIGGDDDIADSLKTAPYKRIDNQDNELTELITNNSKNNQYTQINIDYHNNLNSHDKLDTPVFNIVSIISDIKVNKYLYFSLFSGILIAFMLGYLINLNKPASTSNLAYQNSLKTNGKTLRFQGNLIDNNGKPIDKKVDVEFNLYQSRTAKNAAYTGRCYGQNGIVPGSNGSFNLTIGSDCDMKPIPQSIFSAGNLYLGIKMGKNAELLPRYPITTVDYAANAQSVKGITVGNDELSIPYIDQEGALNIGAVSPTIKSSRGDFTLEGRTLFLKTTEKSGGSVYLQPDAGGNVIVNSGRLGVGTDNPAAELDVNGSVVTSGDLLFRGANSGIYQANGGAVTFYSSKPAGEDIFPALTISGSGNIGVNTESPSEKFDVVGNVGVSGNLIFKNGTGMISTQNNKDLFIGDKKTGNVYVQTGGKLGLGTTRLLDAITLGGSVSPSENNNFNLGSATNKWATIYTNELVMNDEGVGAYWRRKGGIVSAATVGDDLVLGSQTIDQSQVKLSGDADGTSWIATGALGVGTRNPHSTFSASGSTVNGSSVSLSNLTQVDNATANVLRLNLGTATTGTSSTFVQFYSGASDDNNGKKVGAIRLKNGSVVYETTGADFAEYMPVSEEVSPGDIVSVTKNGNKKSSSGEKAIGVISDIAGFVGNASGDTTGKALVGVLGQIPTNVSTLNGAISTGSPIAVSPLRGYGMVLDREGETIGTIMANSAEIEQKLSANNCPKEYHSRKDPDGNEVKCGRVTTYISAGYYNPSTTRAVGSASPVSASSVESYLSHALTNVRSITAQAFTTINARIETLSAGKVISPLVESETVSSKTIRTKTIQPEDDTVVIDLEKKPSNGEGGMAKLMIKGLKGKEIATVDAEGNAEFAGTVTARKLQTEELAVTSATIAGTLTAKEIDSENIRSLKNDVDRLRGNVETTPAQLEEIRKLVNDLKNRPLSDAEFYQLLPDDIAASLSASAIVSSSNPVPVPVPTGRSEFESITVAKQANVYDMSAANSLSSGSIFIKDDTIVSLAKELRLSALAAIDLLNGAIRIDKDGTMTSKGAVIAHGGIRTNVVAPIDEGGPVTIALNTTDDKKGKLSITNNGAESASISASGQASFTGISISNKAPSDSKIISAEQNQRQNGIPTPAIETASTSAGQGIVPKDNGEVIMYNSSLTDDSLVYLTPVSPTPITLAVAEKVLCTDEEKLDGCKPYFKVAANQISSQQLLFNWLIIN